MAARIDLFDSTYAHFNEQVLAAVRRETFGEDIGQNSWLTAEEHDRFIDALRVSRADHALEVACGSGGPALRLAQRADCRVTGIDANHSGIATATRSARSTRIEDRVNFRMVDANAELPFETASFDALLCVDSMNHFPDRLAALREWHRVLRPGRRALFTDPVVVTGPVTNDELELRSSIGLFLFAPPGVNEELIARAGFDLLQVEDVTENAALVSGRWHDARQRHRSELIRIEGEVRFDGLQHFFATVHRLSRERRLSRFTYLVEKVAH